MNTERRLRLIILVRIIVTLLFLVSTLFLRLSDAAAIGDLQYRGIIRLMLLSVLFSLVSYAALSFSGWYRSLTRLQVVWDLLVVTLLLILTEGVASPYSFLYLLAIMNAGMLLDRRQALYTAGLCIILYGSMVDMQYYGMLQELGLTADAARQRGEIGIFYTLFLHLVGFVLAAIMGSHLAERVRQSEDALHATEVNLAELSRLHSTVVEHLESGLLTLASDGTVRLFNPYLERLTGVSQERAYGKQLSDIFPGFATDACKQPVSVKGEFVFTAPAGSDVVIGYATAPFVSPLERQSGLIVTIKDLTGLKQMQQALKRADRLAALGELSARMAHEIRNPLAAISGSVQLLSEHADLQEQDARLLAIVVRESDRLNTLITEFLSYARPAPLVLEQLSVASLVADLQLLLASDRRFDHVIIDNQVSDQVVGYGDRAQLHQALLNLLINAAEAMPQGGVVSIQAELSVREDDGGNRLKILQLLIRDTGCGLDKETFGHLFEPFWTTKPGGTGLGLATVYRILEAHGGTVQVNCSEQGGTIVTLLIPMGEEVAGEKQNTGG